MGDKFDRTQECFYNRNWTEKSVMEHSGRSKVILESFLGRFSKGHLSTFADRKRQTDTRLHLLQNRTPRGTRINNKSFNVTFIGATNFKPILRFFPGESGLKIGPHASWWIKDISWGVGMPFKVDPEIPIQSRGTFSLNKQKFRFWHFCGCFRPILKTTRWQRFLMACIGIFTLASWLKKGLNQLTLNKPTIDFLPLTACTVSWTLDLLRKWKCVWLGKWMHCADASCHLTLQGFHATSHNQLCKVKNLPQRLLDC